MEEERRLLYVGMTRARKGLTLMHTARASRKRAAAPSPFLSELPPECCSTITVHELPVIMVQLRELEKAGNSDCVEGGKENDVGGILGEMSAAAVAKLPVRGNGVVQGDGNAPDLSQHTFLRGLEKGVSMTGTE